MAKKNSKSVLDDSTVDKLSGLIEESTRSSKEGARFFVEPASNTLSRARSKRHHIIFGRRGSGKSSLLHKVLTDAQADRSPIVYIDMESFKGHSYPDVLVSVLLSTFNEFGKWIDGVAVEPGSKQSFWKKLIGSLPNRGPIKDGRLAGVKERLVKTVRELDALLHSPDESDRKESRTASKGKLTNTKGGGKVSVPNLELDFNESAERRYEQTGATEDTYKRK